MTNKEYFELRKILLETMEKLQNAFNPGNRVKVLFNKTGFTIGDICTINFKGDDTGLVHVRRDSDGYDGWFNPLTDLEFLE